MALSIVQNWTNLSPGNTNIDTTGADGILVRCAGINNTFNTGLGDPSVLTIPRGGSPVSLIKMHGNSGGDAASNGTCVYFLTGIDQGASQQLSLTNAAGTFGLGPKYAYMLVSGIVQSDTPSDVRRPVVQDSTLGTSFSLTINNASQGLEIGDLVFATFTDFGGDTAHTPTGSPTVPPEIELSAASGISLWIGYLIATATSHTLGCTGGGANSIGDIIALIPAPDSRSVSGSPDAQAASADGTATVNIAATGTIQSQAALSAGSLKVKAALSGTPSAQASSVAGSAIQPNIASGAVQAQAAFVAGALSVKVRLDGTITSGGSSGAGAVEARISAAGAVSSQASTVVGAAAVKAALAGAVLSQPGTVSAAAKVIAALASTAQSQDASISGAVLVYAKVTGTAQAQSSSVISEAKVTVSLAGTVAADASDASGVADVGDAPSGLHGNVQAQSAVVVGTATVRVRAVGTAVGQSGTTTTSVAVRVSLQGAPVAVSAAISSAAKVIAKLAGAVQSGPGTTVGTIVYLAARTISGAVQAGAALVVAAASARASLSGTVQAGSSSAEGSIAKRILAALRLDTVFGGKASVNTGGAGEIRTDTSTYDDVET